MSHWKIGTRQSLDFRWMLNAAGCNQQTIKTNLKTTPKEMGDAIVWGRHKIRKNAYYIRRRRKVKACRNVLV